MLGIRRTYSRLKPPASSRGDESDDDDMINDKSDEDDEMKTDSSDDNGDKGQKDVKPQVNRGEEERRTDETRQDLKALEEDFKWNVP